MTRSNHGLNLAEISQFASELADVVEGQPFGPDVDVLKVGGKMFAILSPDSSPESISLKCDPDLAIALRLQHAAVIPGYHLNKRHWNTVHLDGTISDEDVLEMVTHSYELVVAGLAKSTRQSLKPN
ncbi:MAG TPA: MmcQ/YjbR family DNA-binding protein [Acidimicrobiales bacterium]|nr:MmcQ/YjbR family DNA-binding protein [Acidimicrobiales bacterium]